MPVTLVPTPRSLLTRLGEEIAVSDWLLIAQERIQTFAEVTDDPQWIHLDRARAERESPYGTTVAHGFLTLSLLTHFLNNAIAMQAEHRMVVNYGFNRVRFPAPVRSGSYLRARFSVQAVKEVGEAVEVVYAVTVECDGSEKPCCIAEWVLRYSA